MQSVDLAQLLNRHHKDHKEDKKKKSTKNSLLKLLFIVIIIIIGFTVIYAYVVSETETTPLEVFARVLVGFRYPMPELPGYDHAGYPITLPEYVTRIYYDHEYIGNIIHEIFNLSRPTLEVVRLCEENPNILDVNTSLIFLYYSNDLIHYNLPDKAFIIRISGARNFTELQNDIRFVGRIINEWHAANLLIIDIFNTYDTIIDGATDVFNRQGINPKTFTIYIETQSYPNLHSIGQNTLATDIINDLGGTNIFAGYSGEFIVSEEALFEADPMFIIIDSSTNTSTIEDIKSRPNWDNLSAVRYDRIFQFDIGGLKYSNIHILEILKNILSVMLPSEFGV